MTIFKVLKNLSFPSSRHAVGRMCLAGAGVVLGLGTYAATAIIQDSAEVAIRRTLEATTGKASVSIIAAGASLSLATRKRVAAVTGVKLALPRIWNRATLRLDPPRRIPRRIPQSIPRRMHVCGCDFTLEGMSRATRALGGKIAGKRSELLTDPRAIVLTPSLMSRTGLSLGDSILVRIGGRDHDLRIRAAMEPVGTAAALGDSLALVHLPTLQALLGQPDRVDRLEVLADADSDIEVLVGDLERAVGEAAVVHRATRQSPFLVGALRSYTLTIALFGLVGLLAGGVMVFCALQYHVALRLEDFSIARVVGATRRQIGAAILVEGACIGLMAALPGYAVGAGLAALLVSRVDQSLLHALGEPVALDGLVFSSSRLVWVIALAVLTTTTAAVIPAWRAIAVRPLEWLRRGGPPTSIPRLCAPLLIGSGCLAWLVVAATLGWSTERPSIRVLNAVAAVAATALLAPPIVRGLARALPALLRREIVDQGVATRLWCCALGVVFVIACCRESFAATLDDQMDAQFPADIVVGGLDGSMGAMGPMGRGGSVMADAVIARAARVAGCGTVRGHRIGRVTFRGVPVRVDAVDGLVAPGKARVSGRFALAFDVGSGDALILDTPGGRAEFSVESAVPDPRTPAPVLFLAREDYKRLWNDRLVDRLLVALAPGADLSTVRRGLDAEFADTDWFALAQRSVKDAVQTVLRQGFGFLDAILLLVVVAGALGLAVIAALAVWQRRGEIAVLRTIGATPGHVGRLVFFGAACMGMLCAVPAVVLGGAIAWLWTAFTIPRVLGYSLEFHVAWRVAGMLPVAGAAIAGAAVAFAAWRATRLSITAALRAE